MKKTILTFAFILIATMQSFAHYLWIETSTTGILNQEQEVRVYYGEYTYGVTEKVNGEAFPNVKDFTLWVIDSEDNKIALTVIATEDYYVAKYTPTTNGTHTVLLNNNKIDVVDYTQYDFGIFKTHYHSVSKIEVGNKINDTVASNKTGITVKNISTNNEEIKLQVLFKNEILVKNEVKIFMKDLWSKTLETDENGVISFKLPFKTKYILETTHKEEIPGKYKDEDYEFIWHCVTYTIPEL